MNKNQISNEAQSAQLAWAMKAETPFMQFLIQKSREELQAMDEKKKYPMPFLDETVYYNLPDILDAGCSVFENQREKDVFLTSALGILSCCFNEVYGFYDRAKYNANLYCLIIAPPGNGKGVMSYAKKLGDEIHKAYLAEYKKETIAYKAEFAKYNVSLKKTDAIAMPLTAPVEPQAKMLFTPANSSGAAMIGHIYNNNGCGLICESEIDTLLNSAKQDWGIGSDTLRVAFHHEPISYSRKANHEFIEIARPQLSIVMTGTPMQASRLLQSSENGLSSRFIYYFFKCQNIWKDVSPSTKVNYDDHFSKLAQQVYKIHLLLKNKNVQFNLTPNQWESLNWFGSQKLAYYSEDVNGSVYRIGLIAFRIAMILTILRNSENIFDGCLLYCSTNDFVTAIDLADVYLEHSVQVNETLLTHKSKGADDFKWKFYDSLPDESFTRKTANEIGAELSIAERTVGKYLQQFCSTGKMLNERFAHYTKV